MGMSGPLMGFGQRLIKLADARRVKRRTGQLSVVSQAMRWRYRRWTTVGRRGADERSHAVGLVVAIGVDYNVG